ncbi:hypothetical protein [Gimesia maris]|uniref:hypothetical protein n=1 Tax=Gimesia maris TaxID=122 RepID=UPI003A8EB34A
MTCPKYGMITPLQGSVLNLAGAVCGVPDDLVSESDRLSSMQKALEKLRKRTGQDFGYDIVRWHQFLLASEEFNQEYTFDFSWNVVSESVERFITDEDRLKRVEKILNQS